MVYLPGMLRTKQDLMVYTDGSADCKTGYGGWGAILIVESKETCLSGSYPNTTNNQMELMGAIEALDHISKNYEVGRYRIHVHSDSEYVVKGFNEWTKKWQLNNWRKVKNIPLWKTLLELAGSMEITFSWVRGHSGDKYNELCDKLAYGAYKRLVDQNTKNEQ